MGKYIVELKDRETLYKAAIKNGEPYVTIALGKPYTEPDTEAAYAHGYSNAELKYRAEVKEAYQKGLSDAWEAARKIAHCFLWGSYQRKTGRSSACAQDVLDYYSAQEAIEEIRAYEQTQKEEEKSIGAEDVMRQYLDTFCKRNFCTKCLLHTPDFTCGRGYHFLSKNPVSDEEVRRAYAKVVKE